MKTGTTRIASLLVLALLMLSAVAAASGFTVMENQQKATFKCKSEPVNVMGDKNTITVDGACTDLSVNGNNNLVTMRGTCVKINVNGNGNRIRVPGWSDSMSIMGNKNQVDWKRKAGRAEPVISDMGTGNRIGEIR